MKNLLHLRITRLMAVLILVLFQIAAIPESKGQDTTALKSIKSRTVVFVTGAFVSNACWEEWETYFQNKGYKTLAPAWPNKQGTAATQRAKHPDSAVASLTLTQVVDHYAGIIAGLDEKPIIMGHSYGGLITQLLVQRELAEAAIIYHSVAPKGVISLKWSFVKSVTPALGLFTSKNKTYLMTFKQWQYTFTNGMPLDQQQSSYDRLVIPESKRAAKGALKREAKIDFNKPHVPMLFISGDKDHIIPASLNYANFKRYKDKHSIIQYKEFIGRNHYSLSQTTWKEDADYVLDWLHF